MYALCETPVTMSKKSVSPSSEWTFTFVFLFFFGEAVGEKYLLHIPSVYGVKCFGEVYK